MCPFDSPNELEEELELPEMRPAKERSARADETSNTRSNAECQLVRFSPVRVYRLINRIPTRDNDMKFNIRKEPKWSESEMNSYISEHSRLNAMLYIYTHSWGLSALCWSIVCGGQLDFRNRHGRKYGSLQINYARSLSDVNRVRDLSFLGARKEVGIYLSLILIHVVNGYMLQNI